MHYDQTTLKYLCEENGWQATVGCNEEPLGQRESKKSEYRRLANIKSRGYLQIVVRMPAHVKGESD